MGSSKWDIRWMQMANRVASWSKDRNTKVGAVIVNGRNTVVAVGWNGFPRNIDDDVEARHHRPAKYAWTEHAEKNAIYNAANKGLATNGSRMYVNWYPCIECARGIIQSGIIELIGIEPDWSDKRWGNDFKIVKEMLTEAGVRVRFL